MSCRLWKTEKSLIVRRTESVSMIHHGQSVVVPQQQTRHQVFGSAGVLAVKEPLGLNGLDDKQPDVITNSMARLKNDGLGCHCRLLIR